MAHKTWLAAYQFTQKELRLAARDEVTPAIKKAAAAALGLDKSLDSLKSSLVSFNEEGNRTKAVMRIMLDEFRQADVTLKKVTQTIEGQTSTAWKALNTSINNNIAARQKQRREAALVIKQMKEEAQVARETYQARQRAQAFVGGLQPPPTQDPRALFNFSQAAGRLKEFIVQNKVGAREIQQVWSQVQAGIFPPYEGNLRRLQGLMYEVQQTQTNFAKSGTKAAQSLTLSWQTMARIIAAQLIRRALTAFIGAIRESIDLARQFEIRISELRTISQQNQLAFEDWAKGIREVSDAFGIDILDTAEAAYQTLSNQVAKGAETFEFLNETSKFSIVTTASATDSVNLLTAAINSFGLNAGDAGQVAAVMFKTIELGRVRASEMANSFGDVAVIASQLGITLEELTASISTLTIQGIKYNKAATQLRGIFIKLIKPTKEMQKFLRELGVDSGEAAIKTFGLGKFLALLQERTKGSTTELAKLVNRIRGISGALALTGRGLEIFNKNLEANLKAVESYNKAAVYAFESSGRKITIELNKVKNFFVEEFGRDLLKTIVDVTEPFGGLSTVVATLAKTIKDLLIPAVGLLTIALIKLAASNPFTAIATGVILLGTVVAAQLNKIAEDTDRADEDFNRRVQARVKAQANAIRATYRIIFDSIEERARVSRQLTAELIALDTKRLDSLSNLYEDMAKESEKASKEILKSLNKDITATEGIIKKAIAGIRTLQDAIDKSLRKQAEIEFDLKLKLAEDPKEVARILTTALTDEINKAQKELAVEEGLIDVKRLEASLKEAEKLFDRFLKVVVKEDEKAIKASNKLRELQRDNVEKIAKLEEELALETDPKKRLAIQKKITTENDKFVKSATKRLDILKQALALETNETKEVAKRKVLIEEINRIRLEGIRALEEEKKRQENRLAIQKELRAELIEINSLVKKFDLEDVLALGDPKAIEKAIRQQVDNLRQQLTLRKQLNSERGDEFKITQQIDNLEKQLTIAKIIEANKERGKLLEKDVAAVKAFFKAQQEATLEASKNSIIADEQIKKQLEHLKLYKTSIKWQKKLGILDERQLDIVDDRVKRIDEITKLVESLKTPAGLKDFDNILAKLVRYRDEFKKAPLIDETYTIGAKKFFENDILKGKIDLNKLDLTSLNTIIANLRNKPLYDLKDTKKQLDDFAKAFAASTKSFAESQQVLKDTGPTFKPIVDGTKTLSETLKLLTERLRDYNTETKKLILERGGQVVIGGGESEIFGKAKGGMISKYGQDRVPALLSPGEFVVNSRASKKFFSQLLTMNAGSIPRFQSGGEVTNVGDVNITLQSTGRETVDIVKIGKGLRRAIRRGRIKL